MYRPIAIHPAANGFLVTVGCQTILYACDTLEQTVDRLTSDLGSYLIDPDEAERSQRPKLFNLKHTDSSIHDHCDRPPGENPFDQRHRSRFHDRTAFTAGPGSVPLSPERLDQEIGERLEATPADDYRGRGV